MAIRKKCRENGSRAEALGSNPHSNGDLFSRSRNDFFEVKFRITIRSVLMKIMIRANKIKIWITYTINRSFDWKSNIIFILYK